jgi:hypothetical protein
MHTGNKTHILLKNKKKYKFIGRVNELATIIQNIHRNAI